MKTIFYVLSLFAVVAALACALWKKWGPAAFWMSLAVWLGMP